MPSGRTWTSPEAQLNHAGTVTHLDDYATYVERGVTDPFALLRAPAVTGVPDVINQAVSGRRQRLWDAIYFGIIHVIPRSKDVGAVVSQTSFQVEIWNADEASHVGQSVSITGSSGVSLSGGPTLPATWPPFSSFFVTVIVDGQGDPIIDTLITWLFPGFTGTDCHVLGFRLTIFPLSPQWEGAGVEEGFGYLTDLLRARDGTEQRVQLAGQATRELTFAALAADPREAAEAMVKLFGGGHLLFGVPYWPDATPLTGAVSPGATTIPCDTTSRIFAPGGLFILWRDSRTWEAFTVQTVNPTSLVATAGAVGTWPQAGTLVVPLLSARLSQPAEVSHPSPDVSEIRGTFVTEPT